MKILEPLFGAILIALLLCTTQAHAGYCIVADGDAKVVTPCPDGKAKIVDNIGEKVVVCSTQPGESPRCQTLPLKD